jgi:hypothetical protein
MRHFVSQSGPPPSDPTIYGGEFHLSGGDRRVSRRPHVVAFLAKAYAEEVSGNRSWPMFDVQRLGRFLSGAGIDLDQAVKADMDAAHALPDEFKSLEFSIPLLSGTSFLTDSPTAVAFSLERRNQLAKLGRAHLAKEG